MAECTSSRLEPPKPLHQPCIPGLARGKENNFEIRRQQLLASRTSQGRPEAASAAALASSNRQPWASAAAGAAAVMNRDGRHAHAQGSIRMESARTILNLPHRPIPSSRDTQVNLPHAAIIICCMVRKAFATCCSIAFEAYNFWQLSLACHQINFGALC